MSLILEKGTKLKVGDTLNVMFRYGATLHNYEVTTMVVRNFEIQGKPAVGCSISNLNVDLIGLLSSKKKEAHTELDNTPEISLHPDVPTHQQVKDVEEDIAKELVPERPTTITITPNESLASDKTLRQQRKEERMAQQAKEIENLLDLRDV